MSETERKHPFEITAPAWEVICGKCGTFYLTYTLIADEGGRCPDCGDRAANGMKRRLYSDRPSSTETGERIEAYLHEAYEGVGGGRWWSICERKEQSKGGPRVSVIIQNHPDSSTSDESAGEGEMYCAACHDWVPSDHMPLTNDLMLSAEEIREAARRLEGGEVVAKGWLSVIGTGLDPNVRNADFFLDCPEGRITCPVTVLYRHPTDTDTEETP